MATSTLKTKATLKSQEIIQTLCLTLIIPTHKTSPERVNDITEVKKAVVKAKEIIYKNYPERNTEQIITTLNDLTNNIDFLHNDHGIGFYISPTQFKSVSFPFPVKEKIFVGENFETRDLMYLSEYLKSYMLCCINLQEVKLYRGNGNTLKEIHDENFPTKYFDNYEYERSSIGSSTSYALKSVEKDKSVLKEVRFQSFLKEIDKKLSRYIINDTPLIISGVKKELGYFQKLTSHKKNIIGKITGNYFHNMVGLLGQLAQNEMELYRNNQENKVIKSLDEAVGKKMLAIGLEDCWTAAQEGKGLLLVVEKDYSKIGIITENKYQLYLNPTLKTHKLLADSVDSLIDIVKKKNGKIMLVQNGKLKKYDHIALLLRY